MHGLVCDPCDCPQKILRASCVTVPREVLMATSAQKKHRENSLDSLSTRNGQFDGAASVLAAALRVWDAPCHGLDCLGSECLSFSLLRCCQWDPG